MSWLYYSFCEKKSGWSHLHSIEKELVTCATKIREKKGERKRKRKICSSNKRRGKEEKVFLFGHLIREKGKIMGKE